MTCHRSLAAALAAALIAGFSAQAAAELPAAGNYLRSHAGEMTGLLRIFPQDPGVAYFSLTNKTQRLAGVLREKDGVTRAEYGWAELVRTGPDGAARTEVADPSGLASIVSPHERGVRLADPEGGAAAPGGSTAGVYSRSSSDALIVLEPLAAYGVKRWGAGFDAVRKAVRWEFDRGLACLADFRLFDVYRPVDDPSADKSMAFRLVLESGTDSALTEKDTEGAVETLVACLEKLQVKLRS